MEKRKIFLLVICFAALCRSTAPASANLFDFSYNLLMSTYDASEGAFSVSIDPLAASGSLTSVEGGFQVANFDAGSWVGPENFELSMDITNINNALLAADGVGTFTITDTGDDTIIGNITDEWQYVPMPGGVRLLQDHAVQRDFQ